MECVLGETWEGGFIREEQRPLTLRAGERTIGSAYS